MIRMKIPLLLLISGVYCQSNKLTILHTNDVHSHYDITNAYGTDCNSKQIAENKCWGGLARLKGTIDRERRNHPNNLLLDAGDQFQGSLFYTYYLGNVTADAMNDIGYDVMTLGNHEFDNGPQGLADAISPVRFPIVAANVDASSVPDLNKLIKPYALFPKHKVAVIGYLTPTAPTITKVDPVRVIDPIEPVQRAIDEVRNLGYNRIIGLSHHGYHEDMDLASKTRGLSLIVGGHSHSYLKPIGNLSETIGEGLKSEGFYPTPVINLDNKETYVVQAGCWSRFLGHIDIEFGVDGYLSDIKGAPIELDITSEVDEVMTKKVRQWRIPFDNFAKQVIGETEVDFARAVCGSECNLGNLVTDVILHQRPHSEIAFMNTGGLRAGIAPGKITAGDIQTMLPFGESIVDIQLTGQRIWDLLEAVISGVNQYNLLPVSSFLQISGLQLTYHPQAPLHSRIISIKTPSPSSGGWQDLNLTRIYPVSTIEFVAKGGDNIITPPITGSPALGLISEAVMDYIKSHSPLPQPTGPRMIIVNNQ